MFIRTKVIKGTRLVQVVESYRNNEGLPRQRVLVSLGDADIDKDERKLIAKAVERQLYCENDFFAPELTEDGHMWVKRIVDLMERSNWSRPAEKIDSLDGVIVDEIESENVVQLGPELVAAKAWDALDLSSILKEQKMNDSSIATAQLLVSNRLIEPLSEWALIDWSHRSALSEMLDIRFTKTTKDRLYRVSDELLKNQKSIESALRVREADLFDLRRSIVLYDVTNTHFEGQCANNPKARFGRNKQKRNDCRQVAIGMAFDEYGFALAHEVFEGNMGDISTLETMLDRLEIKDKELKPVVILDAGFASKENLQLIQDRGFSFLINITRSNRSKYAKYFEEAEFSEIPGRQESKRVEVKSITDPEDENIQLVLCRSLQRAEKERAMLSNAEERFLAQINALQIRIEKGQLKKAELIEQKIGALKQKHPRVARFYEISHSQGSLKATRRDENMDQTYSLCGDYVLKTDKNIEATKLWELYMTLLQAEKGFRLLKSSLGLRPNFHQIEKRVDGHIFISVLAYHLLTWIEHHLEMNGDTRSWKTIRRLLSTHSLISTRLPLKDGRTILIRKASRPDSEQAHLYSILGINWKTAVKTTQSELANKTL